MDHARHPVPLDAVVARLVALLDPAQREALEERAGIIEFDAKRARGHAECLALIDLLVRQPPCLAGLAVLEIELEGATQWLLTTDLIFARQHLADIGAVEIAVLDPAAVVEVQYTGVAMLGTLG